MFKLDLINITLDYCCRTLYGNKLNGTIPKELGKLSSLMGLDLSDNQFSGPIPETFGNLQNLISLYVVNLIPKLRL